MFQKNGRRDHEAHLACRSLLVFVVFVTVVLIFSVFPTDSVDWHDTFYPSAKHILSPYQVRTFLNPPWLVLLLAPLSAIPYNLSRAVNLSLNMVVIGVLIHRRKGGLLPLLLTLTSFPFLSLLQNGSVEWVPALGFLLRNEIGSILLLAKPQSGLLAGLEWFMKSRSKLRFLAVPTIFVIVSFGLWGNWISKMLFNVNYVAHQPFGLSRWNLSLFPWTVPVGLGIVLYMWVQRSKLWNGELLGAIATLCLVPYFAPHSLVIPFALLSVSYPYFSIPVWVLLWLYPFLK